MSQKYKKMKIPAPVVLLAFLGLLISPCSLVTESNNIPDGTSPSPISTSTPQTPSTTSGLIPKVNQAEFAPQITDTMLPEDVIEEVGFYGGGGGETKFCAPVSKPEICDAPDAVNWPEGFSVSSHSWKEGEQVTITVTFPDSTEVTETGQAYPSLEQIEAAGEITWVQNYRFDYYLIPISKNMLGQYKVVFQGSSGRVEKNILISISPQPHMSVLDPRGLSPENKIILTGFLPNEKIRLLAYTIDEAEKLRFSNWNMYIVDGNGMLEIDTSANSDYSLYFFVIGEHSGLLSSLELKESIIIP